MRGQLTVESRSFHSDFAGATPATGTLRLSVGNRRGPTFAAGESHTHTTTHVDTALTAVSGAHFYTLRYTYVYKVQLYVLKPYALPLAKVYLVSPLVSSVRWCRDTKFTLKYHWIGPRRECRKHLFLSLSWRLHASKVLWL